MVAATRSFPDSARRLEFFDFSFPEMSRKGAIPARILSDATRGNGLGGECDALFLISCLSRLLGLGSGGSGIILRDYDEQGGKKGESRRWDERLNREGEPWKARPFPTGSHCRRCQYEDLQGPV
jgi:hypothetical protein